MKIDVRVGRWKHQLMIQFAGDDARALNAMGWDSGVELLLVDTTLVICAGAPRGYHLRRDPGYYSVNWSWALDLNRSLDKSSKTAIFLQGIAKLSYWGMTVVEAEVDDHGDMEIELPPIHEMLWPHRNWALSSAQWIDLIETRLRSAQACGCTRLDTPKCINTAWWDEALGRLRADGTI